MDRRSALFATASGIAGGLVLSACAAPAAAPPAQTLKQKLVGVWNYAATYNVTADGKRFDPQGGHGTGQFVLDPGGRFSWILIRNDIPRVKSNNRLNATPAEHKAISQGVLAFYGTYTVDEAASTMTMRIEHCSFPNFNGAEQKRTLQLEGDQLTVINAAGASGGTAYVTWKRAM